MERQRSALSLVVLTLLQLCRAEIKDVQPQWYSANVINDVFQPKSISELFSTESPFSTANPIIVSSKDSNDDIRILSTLAPPTSLASSSMYKTSTTSFPSSSQSNQLSSLSQNQSPLPQYSSSPPPLQQYMPMMNQNQQSYQQMNQPPIEIQQQTSADFETMQPMQPQRNVQIQQEQFTQNLPQSPPVIKLTMFNQPQPTETTLPRDMRFDLIAQNGQTSFGPEFSTARPPQSNYFLTYQQAPETIGFTNPSSPNTTPGESFMTTSAPPVTSTLSPSFSSPSPTFSTMSSLPMTMQTSPLFLSSTRPPSTQYLSSSPSPGVTVTSLSSIGSSSNTGSTGGTRLLNCMLPKQTMPIPRFENGRPIPIDQLFPLKIRVLAPSGSITNVNFNPTSKPLPISTKKYVAYTITRKPTTRRTPKPRKNTYERCLQGCRKNGQTLCAAPLSQFPVDPKTLRGFPSVCHMACHNSYRKDAFEKVIDGSCSKLRTRIRPIDSESKLKRDELQKVQYYLDDSGQPAVLEFIGGYS